MTEEIPALEMEDLLLEENKQNSQVNAVLEVGCLFEELWEKTQTPAGLKVWFCWQKEE